MPRTTLRGCRSKYAARLMCLTAHAYRAPSLPTVRAKQPRSSNVHSVFDPLLIIHASLSTELLDKLAWTHSRLAFQGLRVTQLPIPEWPQR